MSDQHDLELIILGHAPIIQIETHEETRALNLLVRIATLQNLPVYKWAVTEGLRRLDIDLGVQRHNSDPKDVLSHIKSSDIDGIYILLDFNSYINEPIHERYIKEIAMKFENGSNKLILLSHAIEIPSSLKKKTISFELSMPDDKTIERIIFEESEIWRKRSGNPVLADKKIINNMLSNLRGLTHNDVRRLVRNAIVDDGVIDNSDLPEVMKAKYQLLNRDDVISFEFETARFSEVGGMSNLKKWLQRREAAFMGNAAHPGMDRPKGVLLLGVQGCGKSLAAKAIAGIWNVPLLHFDFGALYNKYIGETEKNLRKSLKTAEVMSPCVLWIDEMEKGLSVGNDDGTSQRVLGALLTWLAENKAHVFVVATANNIDALPPELIRKGRLDEIFFVDLPKPKVRKKIFAIHLEKRQIEMKGVDLNQLVEASEGFSGSEIEQVVVSSIYAISSNDKISTATILNEIDATRPLSVVMQEKISSLRTWASDRTVAVD